MADSNASIGSADMKQWERDACQKFWQEQKAPVDASRTDEGDWPVYLKPLVQQHGPQVVWDAAMAVHGFPPTWCRGAGEAFAIEKFLKSQVKDQCNANQC